MSFFPRIFQLNCIFSSSPLDPFKTRRKSLFFLEKTNTFWGNTSSGRADPKSETGGGRRMLPSFFFFPSWVEGAPKCQHRPCCGFSGIPEKLKDPASPLLPPLPRFCMTGKNSNMKMVFQLINSCHTLLSFRTGFQTGAPPKKNCPQKGIVIEFGELFGRKGPTFQWQTDEMARTRDRE